MKKQTFAETLKELRIARELSQVKCAELLSVSLRTYCDWERNEVVPADITQEGAIARLRQ